MLVKEIHAKTILSKSKVSDYTINPYVGCEHGCTYCYARFMKRYSGHREKWGEFVDVKTNKARLLQYEIEKKRAGRVWISGVCDPYQPLEKKYELTRGCLEILSKHAWSVTIQTKSPIVLRDTDLIKKSKRLKLDLQLLQPMRESGEFLNPIHHRFKKGLKLWRNCIPWAPGLMQ